MTSKKFPLVLIPPGWRRRKARPLAMLPLLGLIAAQPAAAGVFCGDPVPGGKATAASRAEAEAAAISWWSSRAGALGRGYETWENAKDRKIDCREDAKGKVTCQATARPCLPEGQTPENVPKLDL